MKDYILRGLDRQINNGCALLRNERLMLERGTNPDMLEQDVAWILNIRKAVENSNIPN